MAGKDFVFAVKGTGYVTHEKKLLDAERVEAFLSLLPRTTTAAAPAKKHDEQLTKGALTEAPVQRRLRHARDQEEAPGSGRGGSP